MVLSKEMNEKIEQEMAALDKDNLLRPGMSYNDFVGDYTNIIAQAQKDMPSLSGAGFDASQMPLYTGYLDKLVLEQGERVAVEGVTTENEAAFALGMPKAREDKKMLMAMGRFVVRRTKSPEAKRVQEGARGKRRCGHIERQCRHGELCSEVQRPCRKGSAGRPRDR
jgi:hypothetical protein